MKRILILMTLVQCALFVAHTHRLEASGVDLSIYYGSRYVYLGGQQIPLATDAYSPFYNPAGMAFSEQMQTAINTSNLVFQFEAPVGADNAKKNSEWDVAPLFYAGLTAPLNDRFTAGIAFFPTSLQGATFSHVNFGTITDKTMGTRLVRLEIAPSISFKITDVFSIGASFRPAYTSSETKAGLFENVPAALSPAYYDSSVSGWDAKGFKFGAHLEKLHGFSAGITYRTAVSATLDGDTTYTNPLGSGTTPTKQRIQVPPQLQMGLAYDFTPDWLATFTYEWTQNSKFKDNGLHMTNLEQALSISTATSLGWKDGHSFHVGSEYTFRLAEGRRIRAGLGLAIDKAVTLKTRPIPGVGPSANYYGYCFGGQYMVGAHNFGLALNYGQYDHTSTTLDAGANPYGIYKGKYSLTTFMASADYQFKF